MNNLNFIKKINHYDLFNFIFANFNYTPLLDNYIFLDKIQFDPHKFRGVDRNFNFKYQIPDQSEIDLYSYLVTEVIHPHGFQTTPRSILFGIDLELYSKKKGVKKRLVKSYWGQYEVKYKSYLEESNLFIIYGMSFGKSDAWWMDTIFDQLLKREAELIIYKYGNDSREIVKDMFINCCIRHKKSTIEEINIVKEKIKVVTFTKNNTYFLGFEKK